MSNKKITIDFSNRPLISDWSDIRDRFLLKATPAWFTWLSWIALLAAINYVHRKTSNVLTGVIFYHSLVMLGLYYDAALRRIEFKGLPNIFSKKAIRLLIVMVVALLVYTVALLSAYIVTLLTVKT